MSDLHGNEAALRAVLADAERRGVDRIYCLGDVCTLGPRPREVLALVREHCHGWILGNHDEFLLHPEVLATYTEAPVIVQSVAWCAERMTEGDLEFIKTFKAEQRIDLGEGATLQLFHGTPTSHMVNLLATTPPGELDAMLAGRTATVLAGGHTHVAMVRQHKGMLVVNPGSLGAPFREFVGGRTPELMPFAEYAIVESRAGGLVDATLCRVAVDPRQVHKALQGSDHPLLPALLTQYG
ncbi:MAG: metallophosphoesterase family protein [Deltaproteobacteria bacterium]|nr:metallophosphoesterase family protein [Deltaproteobacteria bacterium]